MKLSVTHIIIFACAVLRTFGATDEELQEKANNYIDDFVEKATNGSGGFIDPLPLEDIEHSFEREIGFIKVKGEAKIYDSKIKGLSSMQRKGNAIILDLDDMYLLTTALTMKKVRAFYRGALLLNDAGPRVTLEARIGKANVVMTMLVPADGGNVDLLSCNVKFQDVRVTISGLGPMGWAASIMSSMVINALDKPVSKFASVKLFEYFSKEIEKVPFPAKDDFTKGDFTKDDFTKDDFTIDDFTIDDITTLAEF